MTRLEEIDETLLTANPFAFSLVIPVTQNTSTTDFVLAEEVEELLVGKKYPTERTQKVSIYYAAGIKEKIWALPLQAKSLLFYIIYNLEPRRDFIQINRQYYMKSNKVKSPNTFKLALKSLIAANIICPTGIYESVYWINPNYLFPGNRLDKYKDKILIQYER